MSKEQFLLQRVDNNEIKIANEVYSCRLLLSMLICKRSVNI